MSEYINSGEGSHSERGRLLGGTLVYTGMWHASRPQPYVKPLLFYAPKVLNDVFRTFTPLGVILLPFPSPLLV